MVKFLFKILFIFVCLLSLVYSSNITYSSNSKFEQPIFKKHDFLKIKQKNNQQQSSVTLDIISQTEKTVVAEFKIGKGLFLYKNHIIVKINSHNITNRLNLPPTNLSKNGEAVYSNKLRLNIPIKGAKYNDQLKIQYQYCGETTCYLPIVKTIKLTAAPKYINWFKYLSLFTFLGIGILLAFTPCVLPMLPIVSSLIIGQTSRKKSFLLVVCYILGMASVYVIIGMLIIKIGITFQIYLQQKIFIYTFMLIFIILALSLFDVFKFQLSNSTNTKIYALQNRIKQSSYLGSFIIGGLSSLILSPCTSAPLVGVLTTIAKTGDFIYGSLALFLLAIGTGIPMLFFSLGLKQFVPKAGTWMIEIKNLFAFMMLAMAIYLGSRVLSANMVTILYIALFLGYIYYFLMHSFFAQRLRKAVKYILAIIAIIISIFAFDSLIIKNHQTNTTKQQSTIDNLSDLNSNINQLLKKHNYILLDFYAKWCVECSKLAKNVLEKASFKNFLKVNSIALIRVDVSQYNDKTSKLSEKYSIKGLPTLILIDKNNKEKLRESGLISQSKLTSDIKNHLS